MQNQPKLSFGAFGSPAASTGTTTGGGLFGSSQPQASTTGSSFNFGGSTTGQAAAANTSGFLLGKPATTTTTTTTTTSNPFGGLGAAKPATTGFNIGGGSTATTAAATSTGLFGATNTQTPQKSLFSLNTSIQQPQQNSSFSSFGAPKLTLNTSLQQQPQTNMFGNTSLTSLNQPQQQQQQQQLQQQQTVNPVVDENFMNLVSNPQVFNDERDQILAKWNQLQIFYGRGKVFFQNSSVDVKEDNRLNKFKTIGYSLKTNYKDEDGIICLIMNQKEQNVKTNQKNIQDTLHKIFDSNQALSIVIDSIKPLSEDSTQVDFYVNQRVSPQTDQLKRVQASLVYNHLNKVEQATTLRTTPTIKQMLEQISVVNFYPLIGLTNEQIKTYLDNPQSGIDQALWTQAKKNNPDPKKLLPIPIVGFQDINKRFKLQGIQNDEQKENLTKISNSIESLNAKNKLLRAKIEQFKARNETLEQRVLRVFINNELRRKMGLPLQDSEAYLLNILTAFQNELNSPVNKEILRQKFNELVEVIKTLEQNSSRKQMGCKGGVLQQQSQNDSSNLFDSNNQAEILKTLRDEQKAIKSLIDIVNSDIKDLNLIKTEMNIK